MGSDGRMRVRLAGQGVSEEVAIKLRLRGQQGLEDKGPHSRTGLASLRGASVAPVGRRGRWSKKGAEG